ncbi:MAG: DNA topoisomerase (ATP-hydrolyzing) subunit A [Kiritimatiellia bacterium]|jgi:DNA gyrase subunit A
MSDTTEETPVTPVTPDSGDAASLDVPATPELGITPIRIEDEMHKSFLDYSMSVIVGRALPDVRDGFKPVHRRCIYSMGETGCTFSSAHRKSARVVGEVMGKYHPHGDSSIYETIVRLAQDFSMRYTLVDGHGNFGSMDGDKAAAMRYTEIRMQRMAEDMLEDLDKETVDMVPNYDGTLEEPTVLPAKLPNLLLNGSMGIAVGMATNIPTHNLNELLDAIVALVDDPAITIDGLMRFVKGPDFPTGGILCGTQPIRDMYTTGRGTLVIRARTEIEEDGDSNRILVTEIPYGVNKAKMLSRIGELVDDKVIPGIAEIRDVSKDDVRIEIDLKSDAIPKVVLNLLFKHSELQVNFGANMLALDNGRPKVMNLKQFLRCFVDHRIEVVTRRTKFLLRKAKERAHLLEGFRIALDSIDDIVHIIRSSRDDAEAKARLFERFALDDLQASAILDMRLRQLTGLSRDKIEEEYQQILASIERYGAILSNPSEILQIIKDDCAEMKAKYGDERRTEIRAGDGEIDLSKIIPNENCVITLSNRGYIKRSALDAFVLQKRGGKGRKGAKLKDEDFMEQVETVMTHDSLLFFTSHGRVFTIERAWELPEAEPNSFGKPIVNFLQLQPEIREGAIDVDGTPLEPRSAEKVLHIVSLGNYNEATLSEAALAEEGRFAVNEKRPLFTNEKAVLFATRKGIVKKTVLSEFKNINRNGIKAINLDDDDELVSVELVNRDDEIIIASALGRAVHFVESQLRPLGRASRGVRGIRLEGVTFGPGADEDALDDAPETDNGDDAPETDARVDRVVAVVKVEKAPDARILFLVENGYGTLNHFSDFPIHGRGGKGVRSIDTGKRNGEVVFAGCVHLGDPDATPPRWADSILMVTAKGQIIHSAVDRIRQTARGAKGVRVMDVAPGDTVVSATVVPNETDPNDPDDSQDESLPAEE